MNTVLYRVIKSIGYHDNHEVGEIIPVTYLDLTQMIRDGYVEVVVNNVGQNCSRDVEQDDQGTLLAFINRD